MVRSLNLGTENFVEEPQLPASSTADWEEIRGRGRLSSSSLPNVNESDYFKYLYMANLMTFLIGVG